MTSWDDDRLKGRVPEFARMSLRGGIGLPGVPDIAEVWRRFELDESRYDASAVGVGKRKLPIGRYLSGALRKELGLEKKEFSDAEVQALWAYYERIASEKGASEQFVADSVYKALRSVNLQYERKLEVRQKLFERGKK